MGTHFQELRIIEYLKRENEGLYSACCELYRSCKSILDRISINFPGYTQHDIEHSIRVIEHMTSFLGHDLSKYSHLHLSIVVYVGILHDIGMYLNDGEKDGLTEEWNNNSYRELNEDARLELLQDYIRANHGKRVKDVIESTETVENIPLKYLLHIEDYDLTDIVANICRSHVESCDWIESNLKGTVEIGRYEINPIHIAVLLRLGDVLDIDRRRTPWIIYNNLKLNKRSNSEWKKHMPITNYTKVRYSEIIGGYEIYFQGECDDSEIYRELMHYFDSLNADIIEIKKILKKLHSIYTFRIESPIVNEVNVKGFEFNKLEFQLQYKQIARLLMGENIYGSKKSGLRELIQNSIDAALYMQHILDKDLEHTYIPQVSINIEKTKGQVIIEDNGTGMSYEILKKYFFNIGNSYYTSPDFMKKDYGYNPIGHYGIGFLSAFMLSENVIIETKHFEQDEMIIISLRKDSNYVNYATQKGSEFCFKHGTRIILNYDQLVNEVFLNEEAVINYVKETFLVNGYVLNIKKENHLVESISNNVSTANMSVISVKDFDIICDLTSYGDIKTTYCNYEFNTRDLYFWDDINREAISIPFLNEQLRELNDIFDEFYSRIEDFDLFDYLLRTNATESYSLMLLGYGAELKQYYIENETLDGFFYEITIKDCMEDDNLYWHEIPYMLEKTVFYDCLSEIDEVYETNDDEQTKNEQYHSILHKYENSIKHCSVFGVKKITDDICINVVSQELNISDSDVDISYFEYYPFIPKIRTQKIILNDDNKYHLVVAQNYSLKENSVDFKVYMKGVWLHNINLEFPFVVEGFDLSHLNINIKSNAYAINISRSDLTQDSINKLQSDLIITLYKHYIENNELLNKDERELYMRFLLQMYQFDNNN